MPGPRGTQCYCRRGLTLVEVVVVIGVMGVLTGLLVGAVQRSRVAAAKVQCSNHIRQLGLGLHQHHDNNRTLPPGIGLRDGADSMPYLGWSARILPYLEQVALWEQAVCAYRVTPTFREPPHPGAAVLSIFLCPLDGRLDTSMLPSVGMGPTSYLGVEGRDSIRPDGVLYLDSQTKLTDILDGTASTLLVGERPPSADFVYGWWYAGWGQERDGCLDLTLGVRTKNRSYRDTACQRGPFPFVANRTDDPCHHFQFWSLHPGGSHFLFADGSVRFLAYAADPIMPALATRAGGEAVSVPD